MAITIPEKVLLAVLLMCKNGFSYSSGTCNNGHLTIMQTRKCVSKVRKNDLKRTVHALEGQVEEERVHAVFLLPARDHNDCGGGDCD